MQTVNDIDTSDLFNLMNMAKDLKKYYNDPMDRPELLKGYIFGLLFFEPSTRTCLSFESAINRLGGKVIKYNSNYSSEQKGESLEDTIRTINSYVDVFIIRHPEKNIFVKIKNFTDKPIINAGDGDGEHPTQALLDLFTILEYYPSLPNNITFTGDIKFSRTIHSLVYLLKKLKSDIKFYFVSDEYLEPNDSLTKDLNFSILREIDSIIDKIDVLYVTRIQKERHLETGISYKKTIVNKNLIDKSKENLIIMHPLPRNDELSKDLDNNSKSKYFEQVENGVYVRMSILLFLLHKGT